MLILRHVVPVLTLALPTLLIAEVPVPLTPDDAAALVADHRIVTTLDGGDAGIAVALLRALDPGVRFQPPTAGAETNDVAVAELWPGGIGYLKLHGLNEAGAASCAGLLKSWAVTVTAGLILDLRGAGGNELSALQPLDDFFASGIPVNVDVVAGDGAVLQTLALGESRFPSFECPVIGIIDSETGGAAEVLAGVLKHYPNVLVLGEGSSGDRRLREWVTTRSGRRIWIATRRMDLCHLDRRLAVQPDIEVPTMPREARYEPAITGPAEVASTNAPVLPDDRALLREKTAHDPVLQRAVDVIRAMSVLAPTSIETPPKSYESRDDDHRP